MSALGKKRGQEGPLRANSTRMQEERESAETGRAEEGAARDLGCALAGNAAFVALGADESPRSGAIADLWLR